MKNATISQMYAYIAILAGVFALLYAYFFVVAKDVTMYSLFLLLLGLSAMEVMVILYGKLKGAHTDMARIAFVFGVLGAFGMAVHGGYDLANAINPPSLANADLPSQVDPRGLLSFGFLGVGILKFSFLMAKDKYFPEGLSWVGYISGALFLLIYIARLTVLNPTSPVLLYPVLLNGFIVSPLWFLWVGYTFLKKS